MEMKTFSTLTPGDTLFVDFDFTTIESVLPHDGSLEIATRGYGKIYIPMNHSSATHLKAGRHWVFCTHGGWKRWMRKYISEAYNKYKIFKERKLIHSMQELPYWSDVMNQVIIVLHQLRDDGFIQGNGKCKVYMEAEIKLALFSQINFENYMAKKRIGYRNHVQDKKGKLISVEAYYLQK